MNWLKSLRAKVLFDEPLSNHTTFRLGSQAAFWVEPYDRGSLKELLKEAKAGNMDYLVIGAGSKLLIQKKKVHLAVHLGAKNFKKLTLKGRDLVAGSGLNLKELLRAASERGL